MAATADRAPIASQRLLLLGDDNFLGHAPELFVVPVTQFRLRHLDRASMMRHHHLHEVASTSPVGQIPMSIIIFVMALTFSAKYGASLAVDELRKVLSR